MKAMILAAGLGTRLRPWTLTHPKALVPVGGVPMLRRVAERLIAEGFDRITINTHHFASQIEDYIAANPMEAEFAVSPEHDTLLDTGGGIAHAAPLIAADDEPVLIHNVDILSDAPLRALAEAHEAAAADATLLVSRRESSRRLVFDAEGRLRGWMNASGDTRPAGFVVQPDHTALAFSGIYMLSARTVREMAAYGAGRPFPIMDFLLDRCGEMQFRSFVAPELNLIDIGKPDTLARAILSVETGG